VLRLGDVTIGQLMHCPGYEYEKQIVMEQAGPPVRLYACIRRYSDRISAVTLVVLNDVPSGVYQFRQVNAGIAATLSHDRFRPNLNS
jgi:hypothetical protein